MTDCQKNHDQFVKLLQEHQRQVFGYILALVRNFADADDLFQLTSLVMWRKFHEFELGTNFVRWACGIARLEALSFLRSKRRSPLLFSEDMQLELAAIQSKDDAVAVEERLGALARCLAKVSAANRQLLKLCYGGAASVEQVSTESGRSKNSIYNSLRRIRGALMACVRRELAREEL